MNRKNRQKLLTFISLFLITIILLVFSFFRQEVSSNEFVVRLGNPLLSDGKTDRALNVWDLQVFQNKIYIAGGSTVENVGPINVWAYDPANGTFEKEYTVDEEAIEHFQVFDDELYIPAADPRSNDANKFYQKTVDGKWHQYSSDSVTLSHVRDLIKTSSGDILLIGNSPHSKNSSKPATAITSDNGMTFQGAGIDKIPVMNNNPIILYNWFFSVFSYQNKIYAPTSLLKNKVNLPGVTAVYNPTKNKFELDYSLSNINFIPEDLNSNIDQPIINRIWNPVEYHNNLIYPVRSYSIEPRSYKQAYMNSLGMYVKSDIKSNPLPLEFPMPNSVGEDAIIIDDQLYALANRKKLSNKYTIYVFKANDFQANKWSEVLHFDSKNKARSFEYLDGKFYFGLGQDYGEPIADAGDILSYTVQ